VQLREPRVRPDFCIYWAAFVLALLAGCGEGSKAAGVIIFQSRRESAELDGPEGLYAMNPDGSALRRLTRRGESVWAFSASPDGKRIAYSADGWIWIVGIDGRDRHRFVPGLSPAWSPDGKRLAILTGGEPRAVSGNAASVYTLDGRQERTLFRGQLSTTPTWSPDGTQVALVVGATWPEGRLIVVDEDGRTRTVAPASVEEDPQWSPDGGLIAYLREEGELWVVAPDGTHPRRLARTRSFGRRSFATPVWSPDGERLLFEDVGRLFVIGRDGRGLRRLAQPRASLVGSGDAYAGAWSPDGARIVYTIGRSPYGSVWGDDIVVANSEGSSPRRITDAFPEGSDNRPPLWVPGRLVGTKRRFVTKPVRRSELLFRRAICNFASDGRTAVAMLGSSAAMVEDCGEEAVVWQPDSGKRWTFDVTCRWRNAGVGEILFTGAGAVWRCQHMASVIFGAPDLHRERIQTIIGWRQVDKIPPIGTLAGGGSLVVYERGVEYEEGEPTAPKVGLFRLVGRRSVPIPDTKGLSLLDAAEGLVAARNPAGAIVLLRPDGIAVRTFTFPREAVTAAQIAGERLAVIARDRMRLLDWRTGATLAVRPLRRGDGPPPVLCGVEGDLTAYATGVALHLLRVSDGRDVILRTPQIGSDLEARLGPNGLVYAYNAAYSRHWGRLGFVPMRELKRALSWTPRPFNSARAG